MDQYAGHFFLGPDLASSKPTLHLVGLLTAILALQGPPINVLVP